MIYECESSKHVFLSTAELFNLSGGDFAESLAAIKMSLARPKQTFANYFPR